MFHRKKQPQFRINEFTIFGAFVAVAILGIGFGALVVGTGAYLEDPYLANDYQEVIPVAPTPEEYEAAAKDVLAPFVAQGEQVDEAYFAGDVSAMQQLVEKTQERLLRVRVPADYRDSHLSFVLLLEQWKRALRGSVADQEVVVAKTKDLAAANPWVR